MYAQAYHLRTTLYNNDLLLELYENQGIFLTGKKEILVGVKERFSEYFFSLVNPPKCIDI